MKGSLKPKRVSECDWFYPDVFFKVHNDRRKLFWHIYLADAKEGHFEETYRKISQ